MQGLGRGLCGLALVASCLAGAGTPKPFVLKMAERVSNGDCLVAPHEDLDSLLKRNDVKIDGSVRAQEKNALARVVLFIEQTGAGQFKYHRGAHFIYRTGHVRSRFNGKAIEINPGGQNMHSMRDKSLGGTNNVGLHAHELGHYVGNKGLYKKYFNAVPAKSRCLVSKYAESNRNEEFAESFAAFIMDPQILKEGGDGCTKANRFFAELFGVKPEASRSCPPIQTASSSE